jgi:hypothetical protein
VPEEATILLYSCSYFLASEFIFNNFNTSVIFFAVFAICAEDSQYNYFYIYLIFLSYFNAFWYYYLSIKLATNICNIGKVSF